MDTKSKLIKVNGVIINEVFVKEYDKLLTILTTEYGKITVYAFSCRRQKSKNISATRLFTFGNFELKIVKNSYQLNCVKVIENFNALTSDYEKLMLATFFLKILNKTTFENENDEENINLLYVTLNALLNKNININLIKMIFLIRILKIQGVAIQVNHLEENISEITKKIWQSATENDINKLFTYNVEDKYINELEKIITAEYVDKLNMNIKKEV